MTSHEIDKSNLSFSENFWSNYAFLSRVSKFVVENVFNNNTTIVVLNVTMTTTINDN